MSKIRRALQLLADSGLSTRQVAAVLGISKTTVSEIALYARTAGIDWPLASTLSDEELQKRLYPPPRPRSSHRQEPDYAELHQELKRPGVTLQLLWEEYRERCGEQAYRYSAYCEKYRAWVKTLKRSMRQLHPAGERMFVDYAGQTVPLVDALTGEIQRAQVFVAVLGASNFTFACATPRQTAADWVGAIIAALEFINGVPRLLVPDQPRALIANPDAYEPVTARLMQELEEHYGVAVLPARPGRPQDKAKVEVGVQVVERWILARLRHRRFFSLGELNVAIAGLLVELNQRPFKKLPGCRASAFKALDAPALKPLPSRPMVLAQFKPARVNIFCGLAISVAVASRHGLRRGFRAPRWPQKFSLDFSNMNPPSTADGGSNHVRRVVHPRGCGCASYRGPAPCRAATLSGAPSRRRGCPQDLNEVCAIHALDRGDAAMEAPRFDHGQADWRSSGSLDRPSRPMSRQDLQTVDQSCVCIHRAELVPTSGSAAGGAWQAARP
jgi:transposase